MDTLSYAQRRLWLIDQTRGPSGLYNVPLMARIRGPLDGDALCAALSDIVGHHEMLRTVYRDTDRDVRPVILPLLAGACLLEVVETTEEQLEEAAGQFARRPFDLSADLPVRAKLFALDDNDHALVLVFHHIAVDAWSVRLLLRDLSDAYRARRKGECPGFVEAPVRYADYARWQQEVVVGAGGDATSVAAKELRYWQEMLSGLPDQVTLPADRIYDDDAEHTSASVDIRVDPETHARLAAVGSASDSSLFMVALAALGACLSCTGAGMDIPVGTPYAGRDVEELEEIVGFFLNTLVLRLDLAGDPTFAEVLSRTRDTSLAAFEHSSVPFDKIVEAVSPVRTGLRNPLFQVMLTWETVTDATGSRLDLAGADVEVSGLSTGLAKFDLALDLVETKMHGRPGGILGTLTYDESLFDRASAEALALKFVLLLEQVALDPHLRLSQVDLLDEHERKRVLVDWNGKDHPLDWSDLPSAFRSQVLRTPDAVAVETDNETLTYRELDQRTNRLTHLLMRHDAGAETCVAVILPRAEALLAMLAVLKAGATFLPIDPGYPSDRIAFILDDAKPALVLTREEIASWLGLADNVVALDDPETVADLHECNASDPQTADRRGALVPDSPAYIVYTSGSTGRPKGVVVPCRVLLNLLSWQVREMACRPGTRISQFSAISFDAFEEEILAALLSGQTVVVPSEVVRRDPAELLAWLRRKRVNEFLAPDTVLRWVIDAAHEERVFIESLQTLIQGGEPLQLTPTIRAFRQRHPDIKMWNHYGPSETHVVTALELPENPAAWPRVAPIGKPIWNCQAYVLDARLRPVPVAVAGELYLAGAQLARGYLRRPGLTAQRFVANPFGQPGERMYRTGDIVRWNRRGELEFVGREDDQIKVGGIRVELNEINAILRQHRQVAQAATIVRDDEAGERRLNAYVVAAEGEFPDVGDLRRHVAALLPAPIVPSAFVVLEQFPINANGKLDRLALPAPDAGAQVAQSNGRLPSTYLEKVLCEVFSEVLGVTAAVDDSFFALGGHSMLAVRLVKRVRDLLDLQLSIRMLFENPTVEMLARSVDAAGERDRPPLRARPRPGRVPLSFAQHRLWFIDQLRGPSAQYNLTMLQVSLVGSIDVGAMEAAFSDLLARHESLRTVFANVNGRPYQDVLSVEAGLRCLEFIPLDRSQFDAALGETCQRPFDLARDLPIRARLFSFAPDEHALVVVAHHIAVDGWSAAPLSRDLGTAYRARLNHRTPDFKPLPVQYPDFSLWQREQFEDVSPDSLLSRQTRMWRRTLHGVPQVLTLPTDRPRPAEMSTRGDSVEVVMRADLYGRVRSLAAQERVTPFMVLQAGVAALLTGAGAGTDLPLGANVAGRSESVMDDMIGCFVNTLVLRTDTSGDPTFRELLSRIREIDLEAFQNQDLPFEKVVEAVNPRRSSAHHPLFQVMITMQPDGEVLLLPGLEVTPLPATAVTTSLFDLTFGFAEQDGATTLRALIQFSTDLFERKTVQGMGRRLVTLLDTLTLEPDTKIGGLGS